MDYQTIRPIENYTSLDGFCDDSGTLNPELPRSNWNVTFSDVATRTLVVSIITYKSSEALQQVIDMGMKEGLTSTLERLDELLLTFNMNNTMTSSIRTCLWFRDGRGREAAEFYCSLIPGSRIEKTFHGDAGHGAFSVIDFSLGGVPYQILDAGPMFTLTEAVSISVATDGQAETDRLWAALTANGGEESHCGWLKDRYGVSWQVYPKRLTELTTSADKNVSAKAMAAMMKQMKIDIAVIEAAVRG